MRWWGYHRDEDHWSTLGDLPRHLVLRYLRSQNKKVPGYEWTPTKMTLRSRSQGLPHPEATQVNAVVARPPWVPTIVAFHQDTRGYDQARLHWTHAHAQAGEVIPLYCLRRTFPENFPRNIPERPDWTAPRSVVERLERLPGPHTIDLFATRSNRQFPRYGSEAPEEDAEWCDSMRHGWEDHNSWANPPPPLLPAIADRLETSVPMALTFIAPRWEGQPWYGTFMSLCFEYEELPAAQAGLTPTSPALHTVEHPPVWTMMAFRFERNHAMG